MRQSVFVAFGVALAISAAFNAHAQQLPVARLLPLPTTPVPMDGTYVANDELTFMIDHVEGQVRLRFDSNDEVFYLGSEAAPMGARVLKYDTGDVALKVAGWGGVTVYTETVRNGLPAELGGAVKPVDPPPVAAQDVRGFAARLAQDLSLRQDVAVGFAADWDQMAQSDILRALGCDTMRNVTYALESLAKAGRRTRIADRIHIIRIVQGAKPGVTMQRGILAVTIAPQLGVSARPSSLAIASAIQAAF